MKVTGKNRGSHKYSHKSSRPFFTKGRVGGNISLKEEKPFFQVQKFPAPATIAQTIQKKEGGANEEELVMEDDYITEEPDELVMDDDFVGEEPDELIMEDDVIKEDPLINELDFLNIEENLDVPNFEAIASNTRTQSSYGELDKRIGHLWRRKKMDFYEAAYKIADEQPLPGDPFATQSNRTEGRDRFTPSWAVFFGAWDYKKGNLNEVRRILRKKSNFQKSLKNSYDKVINYENPKESEIREGIGSAKIDLWQVRQEGKTAELMIYFSGHGGHGGVIGVDGGWVAMEEIARAADEARELGIHVTVIIDACNIGEIVDLANEYTIRDLEENAEGLNSTNPLQQEIRSLKFYHQFISSVGAIFNSLYNRWGGLKKRKRAFAKVMDRILVKTSELQKFLLGGKSSLHGEGIDEIEMLSNSLVSAIKKYKRRRKIRKIHLEKIKGKAAPLLDFMNDMVRQQIVWIRKKMMNKTQNP